MTRPAGILRSLHRSVASIWAALSVVLLLGFMAQAAVHDHADHEGEHSAVECLLAVPPLATSAMAAALEVQRAPTVDLAAVEARGLQRGSSVPILRRARAPPA